MNEAVVYPSNMDGKRIIMQRVPLFEYYFSLYLHV